MLKVNATALRTTMRRLKALREHGDESQWHTTFLDAAERTRAERWARGEDA